MKLISMTALALLMMTTPLFAQEDDSGDLAAAAQNPLASMISLPFQNNTTFGGTGGDVSNVLNIQPVYPVTINPEWNFITRTIVPVVSIPSASGSGQDNGLGDTTFTGWFSPSKPVFNTSWGVGPVAYIPTATKDSLGLDQWGGGLSAVAVWIKGPWVAGGLVNNVWGAESTDELNSFLFQYFINYNLDDGWYLVSAPIMTANWNASSDDRWVVPVGGGFGKVLRIGNQPANLNAQLYYNVERPDGYGEYQARIQFQLLFPK